MKKIAILTAARAEYGLLKPIIKKLKNRKGLKTEIIVTAAHLSPEFGLTYKEIEQDGFQIDKKIEILLSSDTPTGVSKSMALALISFAEYFEENRPDALMVLGDRYETLAVCCAAMNARVPIFHLYGGETTEGAVDEAVRHAITKMSYLHFTSTEQYRKRVIQLGEDPDRVVCVGAMGIENAMHAALLSKKELEESIKFKLDMPFAVLTFHPVTLEDSQAEVQFGELLKAIKSHSEMKYIITMANADANGRIINQMIKSFADKNENVVAFESLGMIRYLSTLKFCTMVIGNSSSGIIEAPVFGVPVINIGDRQKGRIQAENIINCKPTYEEIDNAINTAFSESFQNIAKNTISPYGSGNVSEKIVKEIERRLLFDKIELKKSFYDLEFECK